MKLSVPSPCQEDWGAMKRSGMGRHCVSCEKTVVDFVAMTDEEMLIYLQAFPAFGCGRFRPDQLDREIAHPAVPQSRLRGFAARVAAGTALLLSLSLQGAAQGSGRKQPRMGKAKIHAPVRQKATVATDSACTVISGVVLNERGRGLSFASLEALSDNVVVARATADSFGRFTLNTDRRLPAGLHVMLRIHHHRQSMNVTHVVGTQDPGLTIRFTSPITIISQEYILGASIGYSSEPDITQFVKLRQKPRGFFRRIFRR